MEPDNDCMGASSAGPIEFTRSDDPFEPGLLRRLPEPPAKVVILKASRIGDFINATPAFRALRRALPGAEISIITLPMLTEVAMRCTSFDRCLPFPGYPGLAEQLFKPETALQFLMQMQAEHFDLAVQMQGSGVNSNPFTLMLGAKYTAGFIRPGDPPGRLSAALPLPDQGHEVSRNLALSEFLGASSRSGNLPEFNLLPEDYAGAERCLSGFSPPWIGIHTSARDATRRWPLNRFIQAAAALQKQRGGTVIFIGESRERDAGEEALMHSGVPYLNLAGCTSLPVSGAVIQRLAVFLTNDSGPAHMAYAVGAPTVTIFGGGDPARNGPLTVGPHRILAHPIDCRPCESGDCPIGLRCLQHITVYQVVRAAGEIFNT